MSYEKTLAVKTDARAGILAEVIKFSILIAVASLVPLFHQQLLTGPVVNATLFVAIVILGTRGAFFVALVPSVIALSVGLLPMSLAPMIPFIMISNVVLMLAFDYLRAKNFWLAVAGASFVKFIFLYAMSLVVLQLIVQEEIAQQAALMMGWPQLLTGLLGGVIAFGVLKILKAGTLKKVR